ncbi:hypothetical protein IAE22_27810, partial [Bacillus sp. S34]|nr:hypothetical protein [Bacillus sp. S34]
MTTNDQLFGRADADTPGSSLMMVYGGGGLDTMTNASTLAIGAGGKMGTRVSNNFAKSEYTTLYSEASPAGQERIEALGRSLTDSVEAAKV